MGFPWIARYGLRELVLFSLLLGAIACALATLNAWLALIPLPPFLFLLNFFRDPHRRIPDGETLVVSPADGRVLDVSEVEEGEFLKEACYKITIFLSVLNVHVNRAPIAGTVRETRYRKGAFKHAASDEAGTENESNDVVVQNDDLFTTVLMRQIAGAAARRIVFTPKPEDTVSRGQRVGMIKFGSRTELFIPKNRVQEIMVKPDDKVKGAATVVAVLRETA